MRMEYRPYARMIARGTPNMRMFVPLICVEIAQLPIDAVGKVSLWLHSGQHPFGWGADAINDRSAAQFKNTEGSGPIT